MAITPLPDAPEPTDSTAQFNTKAFAWVAALDTFTTQANALEVNVENLKTSTDTNVALAQSAANSSAISAEQSASFAAQSESFVGDASTFATSAAVSAAAAQSAVGLPSLVNKNGYVLTVNAEGTGVDWQPAQSFGASETFVLSM